MDHKLVSLGTACNWEQFKAAMRPYWTPDFVYTPMHSLSESHGMRGWFDNEMESWSDAFPFVSFQQMIFLGSGANASSTTFAVGTWEKALGLLQPTKRRMTVRITDFYAASSDGRIAHDWMMIDTLDLLRQQGLAPLPLSPLPQGRISPPQGDGIPAPMSHYAVHEDSDAARRVVDEMLQLEWVQGVESRAHWSDELVWYGPVPFGLAVGREQYLRHFLRPLLGAFSARQLDVDVFACEGEYCATHGTFSGVHVGAWLGAPPSELRLQLDFGMHWRVSRGVIVEAWAIFDLPKMFLTLGRDLLHETTPAARAAPDSHAPLPAAREQAAQDADAAGGGPPWDNECSKVFTKPPPGPRALDCPAFVIESTDATWHARDWAKTNEAVDTYFAEDWQSVRAFGMMLRGREALRAFMRDCGPRGGSNSTR